jgi:hypothetical protein
MGSLVAATATALLDDKVQGCKEGRPPPWYRERTSAKTINDQTVLVLVYSAPCQARQRRELRLYPRAAISLAAFTCSVENLII